MNYKLYNISKFNISGIKKIFHQIYALKLRVISLSAAFGISFFMSIASGSLIAQAPDILMQNTIIASDDDYLQSIRQISDGGYLVAGYSKSDMGDDKSQDNIGDFDFWIIRLDENLNIVWDKTYGSIKSDLARDAVETIDNGFLVIGQAYTVANGDEYRLMKLNSEGVLQWQKYFGGNGSDIGRAIAATPDGGCIIGGSSASSASGNKTFAGYGDYDGWVLKLNSLGNIEWQAVYGGTGVDGVTAIALAADGGYYLTGNSDSGISGNKTTANFGASDYWLLKINSSGGIEWQSTMGGDDLDFVKDLVATSDGGVVVGGDGISGVSGNKTEHSHEQKNYWIIKTDASGTMEWQNEIGGDGIDELHAVRTTADDGILLAGLSNSLMSSDKSEDNIDGSVDYWLIKLSAEGDIIWDNTIQGDQDDRLMMAEETTDGSIILGGYSGSHAMYDKTEESNSLDFWIVKLGADCIAMSEICNTLDDDCDGIIDNGITETISISAAGATTFCQPGTVSLNATYSGATVQWKRNGSNIPGATSPSFIANKTGSYTCVTTSACDTEESTAIVVTVNKVPPASITAGGATTFCAGGSVTLNESPSPGCTYQWIKNGSNIAGATTTSYIATTAGNYKCRVTKTATGCNKTSNTIAVSVPCKEEDPGISSNDISVEVYPNPNNGTFTITTNSFPPGGGGQITIFNSIGELIYYDQLISTNQKIELNNIPAGIYFIRLSGQINFKQEKLIIH